MGGQEILEKNFKNKMPEVEVSFNNEGQGKLKINVHFNETLSKERKL